LVSFRSCKSPVGEKMEAVFIATWRRRQSIRLISL